MRFNVWFLVALGIFVFWVIFLAVGGGFDNLSLQPAVSCPPDKTFENSKSIDTFLLDSDPNMAQTCDWFGNVESPYSQLLIPVARYENDLACESYCAQETALSDSCDHELEEDNSPFSRSTLSGNICTINIKVINLCTCFPFSEISVSFGGPPGNAPPPTGPSTGSGNAPPSTGIYTTVSEQAGINEEDEDKDEDGKDWWDRILDKLW